MSKQNYIAALEGIVNKYENAATKPTSLPWFLDGRAGAPGLKRLGEAKALLEDIRQTDVPYDTAHAKVCEFYVAKTHETVFRSRLLDDIKRLIDHKHGYQYQPPITTSATKAMHHAFDYDKVTQEAIERTIENYRKPIEMKQMCA